MSGHSTAYLVGEMGYNHKIDTRGKLKFTTKVDLAVMNSRKYSWIKI